MSCCSRCVSVFLRNRRPPQSTRSDSLLPHGALFRSRGGMFESGEGLARQAAWLRVFVTQLLEDNPLQRTPRWRGLYFGGGGTEAAPGGAFIADLFTRF